MVDRVYLVTPHSDVDLSLGRHVDELEGTRVPFLRHADIRSNDVFGPVPFAKSADELGSDLSQSAGDEDSVQGASRLSEGFVKRLEVRALRRG